MTMRAIKHPGLPTVERYRAIPCAVEERSLQLEPGMAVNDAVAAAFAGAGYAFGFARLDNLVMAEMHYVIPAGSPGPDHAAWYSDTHIAPERSTIEVAGLHLGMRDNAPFLHCHGLWSVGEDRLRMGHLLPYDAELAEPAEISACLVSGAGLVVRYDPETNFNLFTPEAQDPVEAPSEANQRRGVLATVRPNVDICLTIEEICEKAGFHAARVLGIGSVVGADFADGTHVASYATEVLVRNGTVSEVAEGLRCTLEIDLVDMDGAITSGVLVRGRNPVCVTFELLIVEA